MTWNTLSPEAYQQWQQRFAVRYAGDSYAVEFVSHSAVRYLENDRSMTFSSEPLARTSGDGKTSWILTVYIRRPLRWDGLDGGEITDADEEQAVLSRLETALKAKIGDYELTAVAG
jgi:hypothetical protein